MYYRAISGKSRGVREQHRRSPLWLVLDSFRKLIYQFIPDRTYT
jgi:hypothetical protein